VAEFSQFIESYWFSNFSASGKFLKRKKVLESTGICTFYNVRRCKVTSTIEYSFVRRRYAKIILKCCLWDRVQQWMAAYLCSEVNLSIPFSSNHLALWFIPECTAWRLLSNWLCCHDSLMFYTITCLLTCWLTYCVCSSFCDLFQHVATYQSYWVLPLGLHPMIELIWQVNQMALMYVSSVPCSIFYATLMSAHIIIIIVIIASSVRNRQADLSSCLEWPDCPGHVLCRHFCLKGTARS